MKASNISMKEFDKLWEINPAGNKGETYTILNIHIDTNGMGMQDSLSPPVSLESIHDAYKAYTSGWNRKFGKRASQFISNKDSLKDIKTFLTDQMYLQGFGTFKTNRDLYLFNNFSDEKIKDIGKSSFPTR